MSASSSAKMAANVAASVRTAEKVLSHLEASLKRGGFEDGLTAYRKLGETLTNQRLWSLREAPSEELNQLFAGLSSQARNIYALLSPYADAMRQLGALEALQAAPSPSNGAVAQTDLILDILAAGETSLTALRGRINAKRGELEARLGRLEKDGKVKSRTASGRRLYKLS